MSYHDMPAIGGQVGDEGLEAFGSAPLFNSHKRNPADQLGAQVGAKISLSQGVAMMIELWDELNESVKAEVAFFFRRS